MGAILVACGSGSSVPPSTVQQSTTTVRSTVVPIPAVAAYRTHCQACHGPFGGGEPGGSEIVDAPLLYDPTTLEEVIRVGIGTMAGFPNLDQVEVDLIVEYVLNDFSVVPQG